MIQKTLYTGNGASLSPVYAEGRTESKYIRLIAEEGKAITDGAVVSFCMDILKSEAGRWVDCEIPPEEPTETEQKARAFDILMGVAE